MAHRHASRTVVCRAIAATRMTPSSPQLITPRCFSSQESTGIMGKIRSKWDERSQKANEKKFQEQMEKMANAERWTLSDFNEELKDTLGSWRNKIPGVSGMSQMKMAKQTQQVIESVIDEVGPGATAQDLQNLGRREKLKITLKSGSSPEDLNLLITQFQGMDIMQQVVRKRKLEGKPLPTDEASMKVALQQDSPKIMSKSQKRDIIKARQRKRF